MRTSTRKITMAVLRSVIGVKDFEMAELLKCSNSTIHSVESGRLKLSEDLALRASHETDVSLTWLLDGKANVPPISQNHRPFTRELYESHRFTRDSSAGMEASSLEMLHYYARLRAILASADKRAEYPLAAYRFEKMIAALAAEFGCDNSIYSGDRQRRDPAASIRLIQSDVKGTEAFLRGLSKALASQSGNSVVDIPAKRMLQ